MIHICTHPKIQQQRIPLLHQCWLSHFFGHKYIDEIPKRTFMIFKTVFQTSIKLIKHKHFKTLRDDKYSIGILAWILNLRLPPIWEDIIPYIIIYAAALPVVSLAACRFWQSGKSTYTSKKISLNCNIFGSFRQTNTSTRYAKWIYRHILSCSEYKAPTQRLLFYLLLYIMMYLGCLKNRISLQSLMSKGSRT